MKRKNFIGVALFVLGGLFGMLILYVATPKTEPQIENSFAHLPFETDPAALTVFPCTQSTVFDDPSSPCILVIAGGKRLVFGAPLYQNWRSIGYVDAVFLFNGHPYSSGGLKGLRLETWRNGRDRALLVISGELQMDSLTLLDQSQASADALIVTEHNNQLDFLIAGLRPKPIPARIQNFKVFDTGDVVVLATSTVNEKGDQIITYDLSYRGEDLRLLPCGGVQPERAVTALFTPIVSHSELASLERAQSASGEAAMAMDLRRFHEICPTATDMNELKITANAETLLLWSAQTPPNSQNAFPLNKKGITLYSEN